MAISKVTFTRQDGNLTATAIGTDHISGLLFDIPKDTQMPSGVKLNDVIQIFLLQKQFPSVLLNMMKRNKISSMASPISIFLNTLE